MLRRVDLVRTDVLEERIADSYHLDDRGDSFLQNRRFLQEQHCITSQTTALFRLLGLMVT
jgi:hypothetical protein